MRGDKKTALRSIALNYIQRANPEQSNKLFYIFPFSKSPNKQSKFECGYSLRPECSIEMGINYGSW